MSVTSSSVGVGICVGVESSTLVTVLEQLGKVTHMGLNQIVCIGSLVKDLPTHRNAAVFMNMYKLRNISNDHNCLEPGYKCGRGSLEILLGKQ